MLKHSFNINVNTYTELIYTDVNYLMVIKVDKMFSQSKKKEKYFEKIQLLIIRHVTPNSKFS